MGDDSVYCTLNTLSTSETHELDINLTRDNIIFLAQMASRRRENQGGSNAASDLSHATTATNGSNGDLEGRMKDLEKQVAHRKPHNHRRISDVPPEGTDKQITLKERLHQ